MNRRKIFVIFFVLFGCAVGILVAHVANSGWDADRDKVLLFAFGSLTVGLASASIALFFHEANNG
ncbi:MAG: hypothetical protein JJU34_00825 [Lunatimonas sp.]|uniref:hypothetical protein n=1 Tax=Lunatimonas sp. TaxID=2060141 RepID=UPI00263AAA9B|nr:hypothetical protein [Lunatimonas sp.]MCC5935798.1 hypothetical protein [Lunatimonas sp.]